MKLLFNITFLLLSLIVFSQDNARFRVMVNNRIGYINNKGEIVIKPVYINGANFSDGVAAVRKNGLYGFIDINGNYILKPQYEYATHFYEGYAYIYKSGKKYIINKKGEKVLPDTFTSLRIISKEKGIVETKTRKFALINLKNNKLYTDTIYNRIEGFEKGISIAKINGEYTVIDTLGKTVVPLGIYKEIESFSEDGFALVTFNEKKKTTTGIIDSTGKLLFKYENEYSYMSGKFNSGYIPVKEYGYKQKPSNAKYDEGYLNNKGELVTNRFSNKDISSFSNNRAFVGDGDNYILIDQNFNKVGDSIYSNIQGEFKGKYCIVQSTNFNWGVIDTSGHYVIQPRFDNIHNSGIANEFIFFEEYDDDDNLHYGICNLNDQIIFKPIIEYFDINGFVDNLLCIQIDNAIAYIDKRGKIIWQQKSNKNTVEPLNIDYMNRGYFYAYSETEKNNGWGMSNNYPKKINELKFPENQLSLVIDEKQEAIFQDKFYGCKLYLSNTSKEKIKLNASDSRLNILLQAKNSNGDWEYIEYLPSSWCGNSYHNLYLDSNEYWDFTIPLYEGSFKTKIRAVLLDNEDKAEKAIYSNAINGFINPSQFFIKNQYYPSNLMDPYNE